jgi:type II secretion system protein G
MRNINMRKKGNRGFTLIELLVVIAIIGILSSVVLASLNTARQKSRDAKRISDVKQLQLALEFYFDANGAYPSVTDLDSSTIVADGYIATIPHDPVGGGDYLYAYYPTSGSATTYHIGTTLEDTGHTVLDSDDTCDSTSGTGCTGGGAYTGGFAGTDPIYALEP